MSKSVSKLKQFTSQYKRKMLGGYMYIECPKPCMAFIEMADWNPQLNVYTDVSNDVKEEGPYNTLACVYSRKDSIWYVVDHLWVAMLHTWAPKEMKMYIEEVNRCMLKNVAKELVNTMIKVIPIINPIPSQEVEAEEEEEKPIDKKMSLIELITLEVKNDDFLERIGITKTTYDNMVNAGVALIDFNFEGSKHLYVLKVAKVFLNEFNIGMNDMYKFLKERNVIIQKSGTDIRMKDWAIEAGWGSNVTFPDSGSTFPYFYIKGITMFLLMLHEAGIIEQSLPKV